MKREESYIEPPEWLKNKKATINPKNKNDDNCFQHAITVTLNHQNNGRDPQKISKIKPFINQYNWKGIEFPTEQKGWIKSLNKIIRQLHLTYYMCHTILNKYVVRTNQNITMSAKIK